MAKMRGVDAFSRLWKRREEIDLPGIGRVAVMALSDLVKAKKTQRDKDWPMIRRLIEADVARASRDPDPLKVSFWLREGRTFEILWDLADRFPRLAERVGAKRPALRAAMKGNAAATDKFLRQEEDQERGRDRRYWAPLRAELERWRLGRV